LENRSPTRVHEIPEVVPDTEQDGKRPPSV
jgi:hypothetical protein